jgi:putative nucleotidyltransferase with HDIG domain
MLDLRTVQLTSTTYPVVLQQLIDEVGEMDAHEAHLDLDLRGMVGLMGKYPHNNDAYHNGETVLVHVGWVIDDVHKTTEGFDPERRQALLLAGLFHDLGKAYTYAYNEEKQRHTFYDHPKVSVSIAEVLLERHKEALGGLYQRVLDLTRLHDVLFALAANKPKGGGSVKYVELLFKEALRVEGFLEDLLAFAKADSHRARCYQEKLADIEGILVDLERFKGEAAAKKAEKALLETNAKTKLPEIQALLVAEGLPAAAEEPDLKAIRTYLGRAKRFELIKRIEAIVTAP